jgi:hypothetical protein
MRSTDSDHPLTRAAVPLTSASILLTKNRQTAGVFPFIPNDLSSYNVYSYILIWHHPRLFPGVSGWNTPSPLRKWEKMRKKRMKEENQGENLIEKGMRHTSMALYFYRASKKSLHKPRGTFGHMLLQISSGFNYYLQLLCLQFLPKTHQK